ncbi:MAG: TlpA disulfide reductase family protein [Anaerolineaceae bacterium]|nr:TlpA disulfide reductase family protein [Anaerolineaceae bacterium]
MPSQSPIPLNPLHSSRSWTAFSLLVLFLAAVWIWINPPSPSSLSPGTISAPHQGFQAPDFSLLTPQGNAIRLSDLRGRPLLLNLWASWCLPCQTEMKTVQSAYLAYHNQGLEVLAVNVTSQDSAEAAVTFYNQEGLTFPILFDPEAVVSEQYQLQALPSTFFIDKHGIIREVVLGGPMSEALLPVQVERLLVEP